MLPDRMYHGAMNALKAAINSCLNADLDLVHQSPVSMHQEIGQSIS